MKRLTAIGAVPEITVVPAEFTTVTETVPVVMPKNEKPLNPEDNVWVPKVVEPLVTIAFRPVCPAATRIPACQELDSFSDIGRFKFLLRYIL